MPTLEIASDGPGVLAFAQGGIYVAKPTKLGVVLVVALLLATAATVMIVVPLRGGTTTATGSPESSSSAAPRPSVTDAATDARTPRQPVSEQRAAQRAAMLAAITRAREVRDHRTAAPTPPSATPGARTTTRPDAAATTLDIIDKTGDTNDWSKRALITLNKLLGQCFDLGRAEDANLAGNVVIEFTLVGEPNVGGLLERVEIVDEDTTISQQTIRDCFLQQLYALELDPPPDGVTIKRMLHLKVP